MATNHIPEEADTAVMNVVVIQEPVKDILVQEWNLKLKNKVLVKATEVPNHDQCKPTTLKDMQKGPQGENNSLGLALLATMEVMESNKGNFFVNGGQYGREYVFLLPFVSDKLKGGKHASPKEWLQINIKFTKAAALDPSYEEVELPLENKVGAIEYPIAFLAHEIRNPLSVLEAIGHEMQDFPDVTNCSENALDILAASEFIKGIVDDVLTWVRSDLHDINLACVPFDMVDMFERLKKQWARQLRSKGGLVVLHVELDKGIPKVLYGDPVRLKHVIWNLFANAVRFTTKGSISFTVKPFGGEYLPGGTKVVELALAFQGEFTISDTGRGVKAQDFFKLMKPFAQISNIDQADSGIGLGMAIVGKLLKLMKGELVLTSQEGKGCTFQLVIPFNRSAPPDQAGQALTPMVPAVTLTTTPSEPLSPTLEPFSPTSPPPVTFEAETLPSVPLKLPTKGQLDEPQPQSVRKEQGGSSGDDVIESESATTSKEKRKNKTSKRKPFEKYKMEVFLVDDNITILKLMSVRLERLVTKVSTAPNGLVAINEIRDRHEQKKACPDLIMMDLQMPVMDGYDAMKALQEMKCDSHVVVLSSVPPTGSNTDEVIALGASDMYAKPIAQHVLLQLLKKVAGERGISTGA
eukprot:gb/GEZN01003363.1/.p1 GENE.gb/GEZN01003363.1/~~gb/GEZN01003363.1/.p1  ORF type:complete len:697 (+),score=97.14 gb/GEZN01003363.1/:184-2091(+)